MTLIQMRDVPWLDMVFVRYYDMAATKPRKGRNRDPDYTAGCLMGVVLSQTSFLELGHYVVIDVRRRRDTPGQIENWIWQTHIEDDARCGQLVPIRCEQEGGSAGLYHIDLWQRGRFAGIDFDGIPSQGGKFERFKPFAVAAEAGHVDVVEGEWNEAWYAELETAPNDDHDDQVDCTSGAHKHLAEQVRAFAASPTSVLRGLDDADWGSISDNWA